KLPPERRLQPLERFGIAVMSVGFFIGEEQAVAPMPDVLGELVRNLLQITHWGGASAADGAGGADYVIIDLPPGTGEPQATLCLGLALDGALLVTTPQDVARLDAAKAVGMFRQMGTPVLGLVENMAGFICPHCGERVDVFPASRAVGTQLDELPVLGSIPLDP